MSFCFESTELIQWYLDFYKTMRHTIKRSVVPSYDDINLRIRMKIVTLSPLKDLAIVAGP